MMAAVPTDHEAFRDQVGVYVLGALSPEERSTFEAHLAACPECAAEVRTLNPVAGALARLAPQIDLPAALRSRVLASIGADRIVSLAGRPLSGSEAVGGVPTGSPSWRRWLAAAAAIALAVGLGAYAADLRRQIGTLEVRLREATLRANASELSIADARRAVTEARSQVAVLAAPDLARVDLAGQPAAPRAVARAFWSRSRGLVFTASDLPALPPGRTYQLWVLSKEAPPFGSGLLVKPDADGRVTMVFDTPVDLPKPIAMAVTIEPEGGVPAPTGDKYLVGLAH
jgi:anti-sigma-K factor RskA